MCSWVPTEEGPFGARAVAEPPAFGPPAAIANAIEDAVRVRIKELPLSADLILRASQESRHRNLSGPRVVAEAAECGRPHSMGQCRLGKERACYDRSGFCCLCWLSCRCPTQGARGEAACRDLHVARGVTPVAYSYEAVIQYFGHNFFQITTGQGTKIVTDPLAPGRYAIPYAHPRGHSRQRTPQS